METEPIAPIDDDVRAIPPPRAAGPRALRALASPYVVVFTLFWIGVLTVWGTLFQVGHGLYAARQTFFHSWLFHAGPVPLPGLQSTMVLFGLNLLASLVLRFRGSVRWAGLWLVHAGLLVLIAGAFVAQQYGREAVLTLAEGDASDTAVSETGWELAAWPVGGGGAHRVTAFDATALKPGRTFDFTVAGVVLRVKEFFPNCRPSPAGDTLVAAPRVADPAQNRPGVVLTAPDGAAVALAGEDQPVGLRTPDGRTFALALRHARLPLPVTVKLIDFEKSFHPNSRIPRRFASKVEIDAGGTKREVTISMNRPFRQGAHTFFQSSYGTNPDGREVTVLAVTENRGRLLPYWATGLIFAGMALHYLLRLVGGRSGRPRLQRTGVPASGGGTSGASGPAGATGPGYSETLNSVAGLAEAGKRNRTFPTTCARAGALLVAALTLTGAAEGAPRALSTGEFAALPVMENGRLMPMDSYARHFMLQLRGRSSAPGETAAHWLARALFAARGTMDDPVFLVNHPEAADLLGLRDRGPRFRCSFHDLEPALPRLQELAQRVAQTDDKKRSPAEQELLRLAGAVDAYIDLVEGRLPAVFPGPAADQSWQAPADQIASDGQGGEIPPAEGSLMAGWVHMGHAFAAGDATGFPAAVADFARKVAPQIQPASELSRLGGELLMNRLAPFKWARLLYGLVFLAALALSLNPRPSFRRVAFGAAGVAFLAHTAGLLLRAYIMSRSPVTNLYSTFVFVAWTCVLLGLIVERLQKNGLGLLAGGLGGFLLLFVSSRYELAGDTMQKLVAVLDSNLWLTAHVLTIAIGFAGCLMAGLAGHVWLLQRWLRANRPALRLPTARAMYGLLGFGLTFTFLGTMLGGVWADQSWGRFWGWDPKENGALLVILWCSILLHARPAGIVGATGFAIGCILGNIVVLLAWQGVNLLGVGMHAYGFTNGATLSLLAFCALETAFALVVGLLAARKPERA